MNEVATAKLAVQREVEQRQAPSAVADLQPYADAPDMEGLKASFAPVGLREGKRNAGEQSMGCLQRVPERYGRTRAKVR